MEKKEYSKKIRERILSAKDGTIFIISDFADIAENDVVRQVLKRLVSSGILIRIMNGIYLKPKYSKVLNEYMASSPDMVAKAIARNYHWTIVPNGNNALNLLGLSTQVPAVWSYITDGPYKTYNLNNTKLIFRHRTNKEITGLSYMTSLIIQAIKTLGKENITPTVIETLKEKLTISEKKACLKEAKESTDWIYEIIKKICEGGEK